MTKLLFLDVDGVLNSCDWFDSAEGKERQFKDDWRESHIDPKAIKELNRIVSETDCCIVLSSTWRRGNTLGSVMRVFRAKGLTETTWSAFVGMTPVLVSPRGEEIQAWLAAHPKCAGANIVILDDDSDMGALRPHLVQTHPIHGLTRDKADEVIHRLNLVPQLV